MRRPLALICALILFALPCRAAEALPRVAFCLYNATDPFMQSILQAVRETAEGAADLTVVDGENDQNLQNQQVKSLLSAGMDALIVNPVDRTAAVYLIRMAMKAQTPVVFINREPLPEDMALYESAYYVGSNAQKTGQLCGELAADYFRAHPEADRNGDGAIQFVLLKGEPGHQDAEFRTTYSIKALQDAGFQVEKLAEDSARWERALAQEKMASFLSIYGDRIECVICNNDEMALGAIEALKAAGYFSEERTLPVVGVDGSEAAREALKHQTLLGTVLNDAENQGRAATRLALLLSRGERATCENYPYEMTGNYVFIPSQQIKD